MRTGEAIKEMLDYNKINISTFTNGSLNKDYKKLHYALNSQRVIKKEYLESIFKMLQIDYYELFVFIEGDRYDRKKILKEIKKKIFLSKKNSEIS